jgi:Tol biopolymer transport system component
LLPTGPGETRKLERGPISTYVGASFFPDGKRLILSGDAGGRPGLYVQQIPDGQPRRIGDGVFSFSNPISPDGKSLAVYDKEHRLVVVPADGGEGRVLPGVAEGDDFLRWSQDGAIFVAQGDVPAKIFRLDAITGTRTLWKTLVPADPAGVDSLRPIAITPDGKSYAYGCSRVLSELYLAEGLK